MILRLEFYLPIHHSQTGTKNRKGVSGKKLNENREGEIPRLKSSQRHKFWWLLKREVSRTHEHQLERSMQCREATTLRRVAEPDPSTEAAEAAADVAMAVAGAATARAWSTSSSVSADEATRRRAVA